MWMGGSSGWHPADHQRRAGLSMTARTRAASVFSSPDTFSLKHLTKDRISADSAIAAGASIESAYVSSICHATCRRKSDAWKACNLACEIERGHDHRAFGERKTLAHGGRQTVVKLLLKIHLVERRNGSAINRLGWPRLGFRSSLGTVNAEFDPAPVPVSAIVLNHSPFDRCIFRSSLTTV